MQRLQDAISLVMPRVTEEFAPAEFVHQLVLHGQRFAGEQFTQNLAQRYYAVRQVGREPRHRTLDMVARTRIGGGADTGDACHCGGAGGSQYFGRIHACCGLREGCRMYG